ncbi:MAG: SIMPL domain-containing protein [Gemmatirosa sp.]|nr:SIMPL domain-containing protein [Gemmatirosa sp.]
MRLSSSILALAFAAPLTLMGTVSPIAAQPNPTIVPVPEVAVTATGEAEVTPDRAHVSIGVQTQAATAADAASRNAALQKAVIDAVKALGIAPERITTSGYNVYPEQVYDNTTRRSRITGYNVQNTVTIDVWKVEQVGQVLDAALAKGANLVSSLSFYSSQAEVVRRRALQNAITRARADAEAMATAAGGHLGHLIALTSGVAYEPPRPLMREMAMAKVADAPTQISEGTQTVTASVTARWSFVAGPQ